MMDKKVRLRLVSKKEKSGNDFCQNPECENYKVRYCRKHLGYTVDEPENIEQVSEKKKVLDREYSKVRKQYLTEHPFCEAGIEGVCTKVSMDVHHKQGKIGEEDYLNREHFMAVCRHCHRVIEENPAFARQEGFSNSRLSQPAKNQKIAYKKAS